jgi:hypothetical protein
MKGIIRNIETGDLKIVNGTLRLADITEDVAEVVMMSAAGELKHASLIGANLKMAVNGRTDPFLHGKIKQMLKAEMVPAQAVKIINNEIIIEI